MSGNPWAPRPEYKKRIITISVTHDQDVDFERMKTTLGLNSDGAVIKEALRRLHEFVNLGDAPATPPRALRSQPRTSRGARS